MIEMEAYDHRGCEGTVQKYVEVARDGVKNRGRVEKLDDFELSESECYTSVYRFRRSFKEYAEDPDTGRGVNSVKGYKGKVLPDKVHFDIDRDYLEVALQDTRALVSKIVYIYRADPAAIRIFFSGSKGFHIEIPAECFGGFEPSADANKKVKALAFKIAGSIELDPQAYDLTRLWRVPNTRNAKTGLYKIPLTYEELMD